MSDKPELTALQLWILRAQREILLKGDLGREAAENRTEPPAGPESPVIRVAQ
jgi:hypothetical protein